LTVSDQEPIFCVKNLEKTYGEGQTKVFALRGVDLTLNRGELVVLLGASGSGKSTLLNILGGLDQVSQGTVEYCGRSLSQANEAQLTQFRRHHVGFVFQFYNLIPSLTAQENVAVATDIALNPMKPLEALKQVGLEDRAHHFPAQLSGGQQQRVAIARAIAKNPEVILCDEPTGALDSKTGNLVLKVLKDINRQMGTTMVLITHNAAIAQMADRVITLADGGIVSEKVNLTPEEPDRVSW